MQLLLLAVAQVLLQVLTIIVALCSVPMAVATTVDLHILQQDKIQLCGNSTTYCPTTRNCCAAPYSPTKFGCSGASARGDAIGKFATDLLYLLAAEENRPYKSLRSSNTNTNTAATANTNTNTNNTCCKPGPPNPPSHNLPNCLILGDSVSIGYTSVVTDILKSTCQVQHGPWDVADGGAGSTAEALPCLDNYLVTQHQTPVHWDVILFNFGLHNLNDTTPESQATYKQQLTSITLRLLQQPQHQHNNNSKLKLKRPQLIYATTTPFMPAATTTRGNHIVDELNQIALQVMEHIQQTVGDPSSISILDLNQLVHDHCGIVYKSCDWCRKDPCSYHYNIKGETAQGIMAAASIQRVLLETSDN